MWCDWLFVFLSCSGWDIRQIIYPQHPATYNITAASISPFWILNTCSPTSSHRFFSWICPFLSHEQKTCSYLLLCLGSQICYSCAQVGFFWYCLLILAATKLIFFTAPEKGAMLWICAWNSIDSTGMFLLLLSSTCTVSRTFLLLTPLYWGGGWPCTSYEETQPGQQTPADRGIQLSFGVLSVCATCHVQWSCLSCWISIPSASTLAVAKES